MSLTIKYVYHETVAFTIGVDLFYLRQGPGIPQMFDASLNPMVVPNIDAWLQSKTQQRYSYRGVADMASAFAAGLQHAYTSNDLEHLCKLIVRTTKDAIFKTDVAREFSAAYWVELMDPGKLTKFIEILRRDFGKFKAKYSGEELYNILCRLWQFSNLHAPSESAIFESLIRSKMLRTPQLPKYPNTQEADAEVEKLVIGIILGEALTEYKGIPDELVHNVRRLQARGLQRTNRVRPPS
jgi:hypothetical protein